MADEAALVLLRACEKPECLFAVPNAVRDLNLILQCMTNHLMAMHAAGQGVAGEGAGAAKSSAVIPVLAEESDEVSYAAWLARLERWQAASRISDKQMENRILEAVPSQIADSLVVGLRGDETKAELLALMKDVMVRKKSIFLYRAALHKLTQQRAELPERFAARIRQAAPPCQLLSDSGTANYSQDLLSTIFIMGLVDEYTRERCFQLVPEPGKTTVKFETLIKLASEINQAKENCVEAGSGIVMGMTGDTKQKKKVGDNVCFFCDTKEHSAKGFGREVRAMHCKAAKAKCKKCSGVGHFSHCCKPGRTGPKKKASVAAVSAEEAAAAAAELPVAPPAVSPAPAAGPTASLSSVAQMSNYHFDPNRFGLNW